METTTIRIPVETLEILEQEAIRQSGIKGKLLKPRDVVIQHAEKLNKRYKHLK